MKNWLGFVPREQTLLRIRDLALEICRRTFPPATSIRSLIRAAFLDLLTIIIADIVRSAHTYRTLIDYTPLALMRVSFTYASTIYNPLQFTVDVFPDILHTFKDPKLSPTGFSTLLTSLLG